MRKLYPNVSFEKFSACNDINSCFILFDVQEANRKFHHSQMFLSN